MLTMIAFVFAVQTAAPIRITVQSQTNLAPQFIDTLKKEGAASSLTFQLVDSGVDADYRIYLMQETTLDSAAAAVLVLDRTGGVVTSVVRSGRLSGKGAINACTKEIATRLAIPKVKCSLRLFLY